MEVKLTRTLQMGLLSEIDLRPESEYGFMIDVGFLITLRTVNSHV